jgi:hypothetical protein
MKILLTATPGTGARPINHQTLSSRDMTWRNGMPCHVTAELHIQSIPQTAKQACKHVSEHAGGRGLQQSKAKHARTIPLVSTITIGRRISFSLGLTRLPVAEQALAGPSDAVCCPTSCPAPRLGRYPHQTIRPVPPRHGPTAALAAFLVCALLHIIPSFPWSCHAVPGHEQPVQPCHSTGLDWTRAGRQTAR